ncbi:MAG: hypothetical protein IJL97_03080, partial [Lachnospiraceae bacterium]|nr:hypothetical protein [Lachnospiraceae bacterium]
QHNKGITTKYVQTRYDNLINKYENEINVLLEVPTEKIAQQDKKLAQIIEAYRKNSLEIIPET